ncbi:unnamed protein product [Linum trigynum]|uniref:Gnk2-homologous domain-containing protein n=1 Tax=Linum trigynum TaxID=586398 RepID=A0AAV2GPI0_9ROSI
MNTTMRAAVIVVMIVAAYSVSVSGKDEDIDTKFCGCGPSKDQNNFPARLDAVLDDVVKTTASQREDAVSGDITYTATDPAKGRSGAAAATSTCFGDAFLDCSACLSRARGFLKPCGAFACGGIRFDGKCRLQFRQIK